jgi:tRNA A-37 threonylcarbamoyl transferase component Bud32
LSVEIQIGRVLAGKYRLEGLLGTGSMGTVVAAMHLGLGRKVALKFMRTGVLDDGEALGRFMREARAAATLRSEHVAQVMDVEVDTEDGTPYIVMEYLEGCDLGSMLETTGVPTVTDAVSYVLQACEGLAEAHAKGIVHRDLKPANLFLTRRPDGTPLVKVLDFGISKLTEVAPNGTFKLTHPRRTIGSPQYMSPEQMVASAEVDPRADIWALGVILYELLTGKTPFVAATFLDLCLAVTNRAHPSLVARVPGLAPGLVTLVDRCLQKSPESRFANLAALGDALVPHAGPGAELLAGRIAGTLGVRGQARQEPGAVVRRARGRRSAALKLIAGGLVAAAIVTAAGTWRRQQAAIHSGRPPATVQAAAAPEAVAPPAPFPPGGPAATAPSGLVPGLAAVPPVREIPRKLGATGSRHRRLVSPPPGSPAAEPGNEAGTTRTRRGPVVTDL